MILINATLTSKEPPCASSFWSKTQKKNLFYILIRKVFLLNFIRKNILPKVSVLRLKWYKILVIIFVFSFLSNSLAQELDLKNQSNSKSADNIKSEFVKDGDDLLSKIITADDSKFGGSLMFSDEEMAKLNEALDAHRNSKPFKARVEKIKVMEVEIEDNIKSYIYLGSILYYAPKNWSVWINDKLISAKDNNVNNELYIKSLNSNQANIVWTMSISKWKILSGSNSESEAPINANNQVEFNFTLGFNQTFILRNRKIVEGKITATQNN